MKKLIGISLMWVAFFATPLAAQKMVKASYKEEAKNIVELAAGAENLSTLVAAVKAAGLVETLSGEGPFTVFAPTNEAFEALGDQVAELLKPENKDQLIAVLTYHVVPAKVMSTDLSDGQSAATVQGADIMVSLKDSGAYINEAKVITADVKASNGVVHIIDKVILPPSKK